MITRDQLEQVVQKKKVSEVYSWFHDHFVGQAHTAYATKCPFLIVQGPSGCGKTTTLHCVAREIGIPIKEYSETTDTTAINYEISQNKYEDDRSFDRRKASRFEHFVFDNVRFNPLPLTTSDSQPLARADSEFDDSDDELTTQLSQSKLNSKLPGQKGQAPRVSGVIIHVESPLMCAKSQKIFIASMVKIIKMTRQLALSTPRRVAIVFETLETDRDVVSLPTKFKQQINIQVIKFNPIIRANMKKFIETLIRKHQNVIIDKGSIDTLISDCDGDLQACINTIDLIRERSENHSTVFMGLNDENDLSPSIKRFQMNKRQKLNPARVKLNTSLMRDVTRSLGFFHNLGKIFYQKRLYPEIRKGETLKPPHYGSLERPFPTENDTEYLVSQLDTDPKNLMTWLHQHYHRFCGNQNLDKASLFLEHLSHVDTISMNSMQSSQFYEMHGPLDGTQMYLAVSSTVFSLYEDQSQVTKPSHKKISNEQGSHIIKTSVESAQGANGELFSFGKPASLGLTRVVEDNQAILTHLSKSLRDHRVFCADPSKILTDYVPYMGAMCAYWSQSKGLADSKKPQLLGDYKLLDMVRRLDALDPEPKLDYDAQHESLLEYLGEMEQIPQVRETRDTPMDLA